MKSHVPQLAIAETAQDDQIRVVFPPGDKGRDPSIDKAEKPSANGTGPLPNGGRTGIAGAAVQKGHCLLPSVMLLAFCSMQRRESEDLQGRMIYRPDFLEITPVAGAGPAPRQA
jgi:hypothetical protein